jgi:hypothetical protein
MQKPAAEGKQGLLNSLAALEVRVAVTQKPTHISRRLAMPMYHRTVE